MFRFLLILTMFFMSCNFFLCSESYAVIKGNVLKEEQGIYNQVIDSNSGKAVKGAKIKIPKLNFNTETDDFGRFNLNTQINSPVILSVEKDGYKPFSITVSESGNKPIIIGIEKTTGKEIGIESSLVHLGDNSFSENSANAGEFSGSASGAFYRKNFNIKDLSENVYFVIGSIIGIDTQDAINAGQSMVRTTYSSPPSVFCNGNKVCEINLNGDNLRIKIPQNLLKRGENEITVKAGKNMLQTSYIDYDDIEFSNLYIDFD